VTLLGEITANNADNATADTATWYLSATDLTEAHHMEVHSRRYLPYRIAAAGAVLLAVCGLVVAVVIWVLVRSRRARLAAASAAETAPEEDAPPEGQDGGLV
jgi:VanZ family protein